MTKRIVAEIDTEALKANARAICKKAQGRQMIAVIKADAYGHGAIEAAKALSGIAASFAVATTDEALELRRSGVTEDILILGGICAEEIALCIENGITMTVFDEATAAAIEQAARHCGKTAEIHIAADTGMGRIGFAVSETSRAPLRAIAAMEHVAVTGVFTHYAKADEADQTFTYEQNERFERFCTIMREEGLAAKVRHVANSAGIMNFSEPVGEAVRAGIILYGLLPSDEVDEGALSLRPALTWKSRVSFVKEIEAGMGVSYGLTYIARERRTVATVSAGYGDGYPRSLSGRGRVLIGGHSCPILGRVCMDQFVVDVTGLDVRVDDEVVLIGKSGDERITAEEIARLTGTISYEVVCNIGPRVPRIYR